MGAKNQVFPCVYEALGEGQGYRWGLGKGGVLEKTSVNA